MSKDPAEDKFVVPCKGCVNDCTLVIVKDEHGVQVFGNHCRKGDAIGKEKYRDAVPVPVRARVKLQGRLFGLRVRTSAALDAQQAEEVRQYIKTLTIQPPVQEQAVLIENIAGTGVDLLSDQTKK